MAGKPGLHESFTEPSTLMAPGNNCLASSSRGAKQLLPKTQGVFDHFSKFYY